MPLLALLLLIGVLGYLWWQRRNSGLTRLCRWRQERAAGQWRCVACGAVERGTKAPRFCRKQD